MAENHFRTVTVLGAVVLGLLIWGGVAFLAGKSGCPLGFRSLDPWGGQPCYSHPAQAGETAEGGTPCNLPGAVLKGRVCDKNGDPCSNIYGDPGTCHTRFESGICKCKCELT